MPRLIVKNVGPIKGVDLELSKINVFMGPQSCGKSTLAKIISFCSWMEKMKFKDDRSSYMPLVKLLCSYHKLGSEPFQEGSYIQRDSQIAYLGDNINYFLNYSEKKARELANISNILDTYVEGEEIIHYLDSKINPKVIYIPSERNFVSRVPNLGDYNEEWDNLQGFVRAWFEAKSHYDANHHLPLLNLPVSFFTDEQGVNYITMEGGHQLKLDSASSGLQSVVPLLTMVKWLSQGIYQKEKPYSPNEEQQLLSLIKELRQSGQLNEIQQHEVDRLLNRMRGFVEGRVYTHTQFIVEEPEQNLFPDTQCLLMYELLGALNHGKQHRIVITTHSPYILYALNNCLLAHVVVHNFPSQKEKDIKALSASIDPALVRVWEIENGFLKPFTQNSPYGTIQDKEGLIRRNYFNTSMQMIIDEFNQLLAYKKS